MHTHTHVHNKTFLSPSFFYSGIVRAATACNIAATATTTAK